MDKASDMLELLKMKRQAIRKQMLQDSIRQRKGSENRAQTSFFIAEVLSLINKKKHKKAIKLLNQFYTHRVRDRLRDIGGVSSAMQGTISNGQAGGVLGALIGNSLHDPCSSVINLIIDVLLFVRFRMIADNMLGSDRSTLGDELNTASHFSLLTICKNYIQRTLLRPEI